MSLKVTNNAASRLKTAITETSTTLTVESGAGSLFPSLSTDDYFYVTLVGDSVMEIVKVTARNGDTFTITRAQDNTTASPFKAGDIVELRINAACINDISANAFSHLTTDGGTMNGTIAFNTSAGGKNAISASTNGEYVQINGGTSYGNGVSVMAYGKDSTTIPGGLRVHCSDGTTGNNFDLSPTDCTWKGKSVLTSAGGNITGSIILDGENSLVFRRTDDDGMVVMRSGTDGTSAQIVMCGKNNPEYPGRVSLQARNGSDINYLSMDPDGTTTLKGNPILTSAGGTISNITFNTTSNGVITRSTDNTITHIIGGPSADSGYLSLYGSAHADYPSECRLNAGNTKLRVLKDGTGYLNGYRIVEGSGVAISKTAATSGSALKLPSGGTWKYICLFTSSYGFTNVRSSGTASGGSTYYSFTSGDDAGTVSLIAIRTA